MEGTGQRTGVRKTGTEGTEIGVIDKDSEDRNRDKRKWDRRNRGR